MTYWLLNKATAASNIDTVTSTLHLQHKSI